MKKGKLKNATKIKKKTTGKGIKKKTKTANEIWREILQEDPGTKRRNRNRFEVWASLAPHDPPWMCPTCELEEDCDFWVMKTLAEKQEYLDSGIPIPRRGLIFEKNLNRPGEITSTCTFYRYDTKKEKKDKRLVIRTK